MEKRHRTKIIATLGPATDDHNVLQACLQNGVDCVRINFSHGTLQDHQRRAATAREIAVSLNKEISVLADLQGPKIRISSFKQDSITLIKGQTFCLDAKLEPKIGDDTQVGIDYKALPNDVNTGDTLLLDDGLIELLVTTVETSRITCLVINGGVLKNHKGINKLGGGLSAPALTDKDKIDLQSAIQMQVDYIAISFPRHAEDMNEAARLLKQHGGEHIGLIAKIERKEAVDNCDEIILASNGVMVARGDLAVEIGDAAVPAVQKHIIQRARSLDTMVITATQMMESMINHPVPTRAEVSDVANAVLDGTDAVMLSAETASGHYPAETISAMVRVCLASEQNPKTKISGHRLECQFNEINEAIAMATMYTANHLHIKAIIALTESGATTLLMSRIRSGIPIYGLTRHLSALRRMTLYRGVFPLYFDPTTVDRREVNAKAILHCKQMGLINDGDLVIITKGDFMGTQGATNALRIVKV